MRHFKDKVERDLARERQEAEDRKAKQREVQQHLLRQIEEKRLRTKGMSLEEFELNKDLLKEIAGKRKELKEALVAAQTEGTQKAEARLPYEIYNL